MAFEFPLHVSGFHGGWVRERANHCSEVTKMLGHLKQEHSCHWLLASGRRKNGHLDLIECLGHSNPHRNRLPYPNSKMVHEYLDAEDLMSEFSPRLRLHFLKGGVLSVPFQNHFDVAASHILFHCIIGHLPHLLCWKTTMSTSQWDNDHERRGRLKLG